MEFIIKSVLIKISIMTGINIITIERHKAGVSRS